MITFAKNNSCEKVNDFIADLTKNIEDLKNKLNFVNPNIHHKNNTKNLTKDINHQEKENATSNIKISGNSQGVTNIHFGTDKNCTKNRFLLEK